MTNEELKKIHFDFINGKIDMMTMLRTVRDSTTLLPNPEESFNAFKQTWIDFPSQDIADCETDRSSFRDGWVSCYSWLRKEILTKSTTSPNISEKSYYSLPSEEEFEKHFGTRFDRSHAWRAYDWLRSEIEGKK